MILVDPRAVARQLVDLLGRRQQVAVVPPQGTQQAAGGGAWVCTPTPGSWSGWRQPTSAGRFTARPFPRRLRSTGGGFAHPFGVTVSVLIRRKGYGRSAWR